MATTRPVEEETMTPDEQRALSDLLADYKAAASIHVPGYRGGGLARKIAIALIQNGWRKQSA